MAFPIIPVPASAFIGDTVVIESTGVGIREFDGQYTNNVVTFNGVIAEILEATDIVAGKAKFLKVLIPVGSITGDLIVETFIGDTTSDNFIFTVEYNDEIFPKKEPEPYAKGSINGVVKTIGNVALEGVAVYNKDMAFSNFNEVHDENSMIQNVVAIILTQKGERLFEPEFGTTIDQLLFRIYDFTDSALETEILKEIKTAIERWEPRVQYVANESFVSFDKDDQSIINVVVSIRLPAGIVRQIGLTLTTSIANEQM
jgi:phage baseplate assembly protein W